MIKKLKDEVFTPKKIRIGYLIILFLVFINIIFTENGFIDYIRAQNFISQKEKELLHLGETNLSLEKEILRIQTDKEYQEKIIREKLGAISSDEYLVLFAEETHLDTQAEAHL